jgi:hypothetical protein
LNEVLDFIRFIKNRRGITIEEDNIAIDTLKMELRVLNQNETAHPEEEFGNYTDCFTLPSGHSKVEPISLKERNRVADILGQAAMKPVSEMIIEDRGEW